MNEKIVILMIDDDEIDRHAVARYIKKENLPYELYVSPSKESALKALKERHYDIILLDYDLRTATGLEILPYIEDTPVIIVTGGGNEKIAVEAMRLGASDYLVKDSDRNFLAVLPLTIKNVLEHKKAERDLRERDERFRALTEKVNDLVIILSEDNAITYASPSIKNFGYLQEDVLGQQPRNFVHHQDLGKLHKARETSLKTPGETVTMCEMRVRHKDGTWFDVEGVVTCLLDQPGIKGFVFNGRDISERKQAQEERLKLEAHMQQVQKFNSLNLMAGSIAHTFNNVLTGVLGNLELALTNLKENSPVKGNIEKADKAAKRVAELSRLMLTYVGQAKGDSEVIDMKELVGQLAGMLEAAVSKKADLRFRFPDKRVLFMGDIAQIRQVIMNLVSNAVEALNETGGTIQITGGTVFCDKSHFRKPYLQEMLPEGTYAFLDVTDDGCGMDEETRLKAFDPFFTTRFKGRGMGLAAVLGIMRAHRGSISLESTPGRGTTVRILLPSVEETVEPMEKCPEETPSWHGTGTILLVDDEEMVREVGRDMLEALGYNALTASDGVEALEVFRKHQKEIVCVLLDMIMPRMGGAETFRELRAMDENIKVLLCSGYTEEQVAKRFVDILPAPFMGKPFKLSILAEKLQKLLG